MRQGLAGLRLDHFHSAIHHLHVHHPRCKTVDLLMSEVSIEAIDVSTTCSQSFPRIFPWWPFDTFSLWCFTEVLWQAARGAKAGKSLAKNGKTQEVHGKWMVCMLICTVLYVYGMCNICVHIYIHMYVCLSVCLYVCMYVFSCFQWS